MSAINPSKRLLLELVSLVLLLITWCFTIPGIFLYRNTGVATVFMEGTLDFSEIMGIFTSIVNMIFKGENGEKLISLREDPNEGSGGLSIFKALGHDIFAVNCAFYTIITAFQSALIWILFLLDLRKIKDHWQDFGFYYLNVVNAITFSVLK